jgi:hypothetical protein
MRAGAGTANPNTKSPPLGNLQEPWSMSVLRVRVRDVSRKSRREAQRILTAPLAGVAAAIVLTGIVSAERVRSGEAPKVIGALLYGDSDTSSCCGHVVECATIALGRRRHRRRRRRRRRRLVGHDPFGLLRQHLHVTAATIPCAQCWWLAVGNPRGSAALPHGKVCILHGCWPARWYFLSFRECCVHSWCRCCCCVMSRVEVGSSQNAD